MKRNLKLISMMMVFVISISVFTGCSNNKKEARKDEQGRTILTVGGWEEGEEALKILNGRKALYEELNPDVVIEPNYWRFDRKTFYAKAAGNQLPTVYSAQFTEMPEVIGSGYSADLSDALKKHGFDGMINSAVLDTISDDDGRIFAYPNHSYLMGLGFNAKVFEECGLLEADGTPIQPKTWDDVLAYAIKIKEKTGKPSLVLPTANRSGGWIFTCFAWSFGVDFMEKNEDGKWIATFDTPEAVAALQWYKDLKWKYELLPSNVIVDDEEWYKQFAIGNGAMTICAGGYPNRTHKYGMTPDEIGMMGIPAGPKNWVTLLGGDINLVTADASDEEIDAAVRWFRMTKDFKLTDEYKKDVADTIQRRLDDGKHVGITDMSIWSPKAESVSWYVDYINSHANSNQNHVRLYNEFLADCPAEVRAEEPVCAQELYAILDGCIQQVLTDENADCATIIKNANKDFQINYLDTMN